MTQDTLVPPRMSVRERSNSTRRKSSIDPLTGQPYHYYHRRISHHDPARGRDPTPPPSKPTKARPSWATLITKYQLEGSAAIVAAMLGAHILLTLLASPGTISWTGWTSQLTALIPPFLWSSSSSSISSSSTGTPLATRQATTSWIAKAFILQYETRVVTDPDTSMETMMYGKGWDDLYMVFLWILIWTGLREGVMTHFFIPLGRRFHVGEKPDKRHPSKKESTATTVKSNGKEAQTVQHAHSTLDSSSVKAKKAKEEHAREGKLLRFAEQGWLVLYDGCMWTFGMIQLYHSPYWGDSRWFWLDYPKTLLSPTFKWYYLVQLAFWLQQLLLALLGIEKRRKDFLEFLIHHIITCLLVGFSYSFNLTSVGHAVLCAMDFSDIVLAACKMLKYMHKDQIADVGFVFFVVTWIASRHYYYGKIIHSVWTEPRVYAEMGWNPSRGLFFTENILNGFLFLLVALYCVLIFWLLLIFRVVIKVLKGENSEDVRSEDEEEEDVEEQAIAEDTKKDRVEEQAIVEDTKNDKAEEQAKVEETKDEKEEEEEEEDAEEMEEMTFEVSQKVMVPQAAVDPPVTSLPGLLSDQTHSSKPTHPTYPTP